MADAAQQSFSSLGNAHADDGRPRHDPAEEGSNRRRQLPAQPWPLYGREHQLAALADSLAQPEVRLVTLTGPGGVGKTRLALAAAARAERFYARVAFVALAPVADPDLLFPTISQVLGLRELPHVPPVERVVAHLRGTQTLLVLDNFEHLLVAAPQIADLLVACPKLTLLVTSRAALRLRWEHTLVVPPLAFPDERQMLAPEELAKFPAVALFVERAQLVQPDFVLANANTEVIAKICRQLDGLPLALELAAVRLRVLGPEQLLARLNQRMALLTGGLSDLPERQQTLRNTLDWSYELLDATQRRLFAQLAVFGGGWMVEAAEAVCGTDADQPVSVLDGLDVLAGQALLYQEPGADGELRFGMLETIREYALERLTAVGDVDAVRRAHAEYYLALAEAAAPELMGPQQQSWLKRLDREQDNFRAALHWALSGGTPMLVLRLAGAIWQYWQVRGQLSEGRHWLEEALAVTPDAPANLRAQALDGLGTLVWLQGDAATGGTYLEEGLGLSRAAGDVLGLARSLAHVGFAAVSKGDHERAKSVLEECLTLNRTIGNTYGQSVVHNHLGNLAADQGDVVAARFHLLEGLELARLAGNQLGVAIALSGLGLLAARSGNQTEAWARLNESLECFRAVGEPQGTARSLAYLGLIEHDLGDEDHARAHLEESLLLSREANDIRGMNRALKLLGRLARERGDYDTAADCLAERLTLNRSPRISPDGLSALEDLAELAGLQRQAERAARLYGAADTWSQALGIDRPPEDERRQARQRTAVRAMLGESRWATAWREGQELSSDEVIALARAHDSSLAANDESTGASARVAFPGGLSMREVEVLRLVTQGLTDAEVAKRLFLSRRTVSQHLRSVYNKLGVSSRAAATRFAVEHDLV